MERVLEHLKGKGFKVRPKAADRSQAVGPQVSKVRALWLFLHVDADRKLSHFLV